MINHLKKQTTELEDKFNKLKNISDELIAPIKESLKQNVLTMFKDLFDIHEEIDAIRFTLGVAKRSNTYTLTKFSVLHKNMFLDLWDDYGNYNDFCFDINYFNESL